MPVLLVELFTLLFSLCISTFFILLQRRVLVRLLTATRQGKLTSLEVYQDYARARETSVRLIRLMALLLALLFLVLAFGVQLSVFGLSPLLVASIGYIEAFTYILALGMTDVGMTLFVDRAALSNFMNSSFSWQTIALYKLKQVCIEWGPFAFLIQGAILLAPLAIPTVPLLLTVFSCIIICTRFIYNAFFLQLHQASVPLSQTPFSYLLPRLQAWSRLTGVALPDIRVTQDMQVGRTGLRLVGLRKPVFYISMALLQYTDWRQQDALFTYTLSLVKIQVVQKTLFAILAISFVIFLLLITLYALVVLQVVWIVPIAVLLVVIVRRVLTYYTRHALSRLHFEADRQAAFLTGDPVALIVALHVLDALNGHSTSRQSSVFIPATRKRVEALVPLLQEQRQLASFAHIPVPCIIQVQIQSHPVTTNFLYASGIAPSFVPTQPYHQPLAR